MHYVIMREFRDARTGEFVDEEELYDFQKLDQATIAMTLLNRTYAHTWCPLPEHNPDMLEKDLFTIYVYDGNWDLMEIIF